MEKLRRLAEELSSNGEVKIDMRLKASDLDKKIYKFIKDVAENGANKKSTKEFTDIWGLEGMELFVR